MIFLISYINIYLYVLYCKKIDLSIIFDFIFIFYTDLIGGVTMPTQTLLFMSLIVKIKIV